LKMKEITQIKSYQDILSLRLQVFFPNETNLDIVKLKEDETALHFGIYDDNNNNLIACVTLIINDDINIRFSYLSVRKDLQQKGYGSKLVNWIIDDFGSKNNYFKRIWCNSRLTSNNYYKRFGFRDTDKSFTRPDGVQFIVMEKILYTPEIVPYDQVLEMRQKVMYPNNDIDFVKLVDDEQGKHFGIYHPLDQLVSVMSIFITEEQQQQEKVIIDECNNTITCKKIKSLQFRKLATKIEEQSKGFASILMVWLIEYSKANNINRIWCNSRKNASKFYKKFGYIETNQTYTKNNIEFVIMEQYLQ